MHRVCVSRSRYVGIRRFLLACVPSMRASTMAHDRATSEIEQTFPQRSRNEGQKSGDPTGRIARLRSKFSYASVTCLVAATVPTVSVIQTPLCIYKSLCAPVCTRACMEEWRARRPWLVGNNFRMNLNGTLRAPSLSPPLLLLSPTTSRCPSTCFTLSRSRSVLLLPDVTSLSLPLSLAHHLSLFFLFFYSVRSLERSSLYISYRTLYPPASLSPPSLGFLRRQWCSTGAETRTRG